ncbi:MAG: class I SAM-dependent methyltransferase [Bacteroidetes bacterium]|nr:class I SAM-dependent methyltransferase [Bacteroidota bacterium]MBU1116500.1 class I SAM-dependent methyltransferase [Bacteroidota bacterium]MBU1797154.1 class I SAM-dependent methyltransferase [Bacteroidota bacterium]
MKIDEAYNNWSDIYDTNENKTRDLELVVGKTLLANKYFSNIIELGCGTGKNTEWLIDKCDSLIGVDFSSEMLAKAKSKIVSDKVKYVEADLLKPWTFNNKSADLMTFSLVLEHIADLEFVFSEAHKLLNENGLFYICELHPFKQYIGSKARFEINNRIIKLETYVHHISDYLEATKSNFKLLQLNEWFDDDEKVGMPRLVSFLFQKM